MPSLFDLMNQPSQAQGLAPLPTGNLGAGSPQPLQLGAMVAENNAVDPKLVSMLKNAFGGQPQAQAPAAPSHMVPAQPVKASVNPFSNFANKATGKDYK
jgi:acyl-CoA thioesterase